MSFLRPMQADAFLWSLKGVMSSYKVTLVGRKKNGYLLKFRVILIVLTLLTTNMTTKLLHHPPMLREEGLYLRSTFLNIKSNMFVFNYNIQCQIMNIASIWDPNYKQVRRKTHFFFCLLYSPVGVSLVRLQQQSANILDSIFHWISFFHFGNVIMVFLHVHRRRLPRLQEKFPNGNAENEVRMTWYTPQHCLMKVAPA
jgi:hypothetical protein